MKVHHGVRIKDAAILAAAHAFPTVISRTASSPDKSHRLDRRRPPPACACRSISLPVEIDEIERRIMQLEIERQALLKESDAHSKERRKQIEKELAVPEGRFQRTQGRAGRRKKEAIGKNPQAQGADRNNSKAEEQKYERAGELAKVAENPLRENCGRRARPEASARALSSAVQKDAPMLKEEVDEEDIAKLVSKMDRNSHGPICWKAKRRKLVQHGGNGCGSALLARD